MHALLSQDSFVSALASSWFPRTDPLRASECTTPPPVSGASDHLERVARARAEKEQVVGHARGRAKVREKELVVGLPLELLGWTLTASHSLSQPGTASGCSEDPSSISRDKEPTQAEA